MINIARRADQTSGIFQRFFFTLSANLPDELRTDGASIVGNLELVPGAVFNFFEATQFTPEFDQADEDDSHGGFYSHSFSGFCAGNTPDLAAAMLKLKGRRFVLLFKDFDGQLKLVGDKEHYLVFECKYTSGTKPGERQGYKFSFKGKSRNPAYFYHGQFEVADEGIIKLPEAGAPVLVEDTHGNLIASIPAGRKLIIRSGFKLTYTII